MSILGNYKIENSPFLCGYFISIYHKILANFNFNGLEKKVPLPKRIHIGAKYIGNVGTSHKDSDNSNETSILFFNNPFWKIIRSMKPTIVSIGFLISRQSKF